MATAENTTGTGTGNQVVGKVVILYGSVKAIANDGTERVLAPNSPVFAYDSIITESDGRVSIVLDDPAQSQIDIGRMSHILIDEDIFAGVTPEDVAAAAADVEQIQEALLAEGFDPTIELEAPAAGGSPAAGGGHPVADFVRVTHEGEVTSGAETRGITGDTVDPIPGAAAEEVETSTPAIAADNGEVWEAGLPDGSAPLAFNTTASGALTITHSGPAADTTALLEIQDAAGSWVAITADNTLVAGEYGDLFVDQDGAWRYELRDNTLDHPDSVLDDGDSDRMEDDPVFDNFATRVTDTTGDMTDTDGIDETETLTIAVYDDGPIAVDDETTGAEDATVTYNVITNNDGTSDTPGADGAILTDAVLAPEYEGTGEVTFEENGEITFDPVPGFTGPKVEIDYTLTDGDEDLANATLTILYPGDSDPTIVANADDGEVWESDLPDGSGGGTTTDSGHFVINTGNDTLELLEVQDVNGAWIGITADNTLVQGEYGELRVDMDGSWEYEIFENTLDHPDFIFTDGDGDRDRADQVFDHFAVRATDSDGDSTFTDGIQASEVLTIAVNDDGPEAVNDNAGTFPQDTTVTYNVLANDVPGADDVTTLTAATLATPGAGAVTGFTSSGNITFDPNPNFSGTARINYTITDADKDTSTANLYINYEAPPPPPPRVTVNDIIVDEGDDAVFTVNVFNAGAGDTLSLSLSDGSADSPADYDSPNPPGFEYYDGSTWVPVTVPIALSPGSSSFQVRTDTVFDETPEDNETFNLTALINNVDGPNPTDTGVATIVDPENFFQEESVDEDASITVTVSGDAIPDGAHTGVLPNDPGTTVTVLNNEFTYDAPDYRDHNNTPYDPDGDTDGTDVETFTFNNSGGGTTTVEITILDTAPTANPDPDPAFSEVEGAITTKMGNVLNNDTPSADGGNWVITTGPLTGSLGDTLNMTGDGDWSYSWPASVVNPGGAPVDNIFNYTMRDADGSTSSSTLTLTILDTAPEANADTDSVLSGSTATGNVVIGGTDAGDANVAPYDGVADTESADGWNTGSPTGGAVVGVVAGTAIVPTIDGSGVGAANSITTSLGELTLYANGSYTYDANSDMSGIDTFTYTVMDGDGSTDFTNLTITVTDETAPTNTTGTVEESDMDLTQDAGELAASSVEGTTPAGPDESDIKQALNVQSGYTAVAKTGTTSHGSYEIFADGTYTYTLVNAADHSGRPVPVTDIIPYNVTDGGDTITNTLTITIVDDAPLTTDIDIGTGIFFHSEDAGFDNMVGVYELDGNGNPTFLEIIVPSTDDLDGPPDELVFTTDDPTNVKLFLIANGANKSLTADMDFRFIPGTPDGTPPQLQTSTDNGSTWEDYTKTPVYFMDKGLNPDGEPHFAAISEDQTTGRAEWPGWDIYSEDDPVNGTALRSIPDPASGQIVLIGTEDEPGNKSDHDFNDAVLYAADGFIVHEDGLKSPPNLDEGTMAGDTSHPVSISGNFFAGGNIIPGADLPAHISVNGGASFEIAPGGTAGPPSTTITSALGNELVIDSDGTWTYTLVQNTLTHTDTDPGSDGDSDREFADQVQETFSIEVTDDDGSPAVGPTINLVININDDGPIAVDDNPVDPYQNDAPVVYNVMDNDTPGADGATLTGAELAEGFDGAGTIDPVNPDGNITFIPNPDFSGPVEIDYTITDGDGDMDSATLMLSLLDDGVEPLG